MMIEEIFEEDDYPALEAAKYLIQLYFTSEYKCTRQKLQKIIIFAHLALLIDGCDGILKNEFITAYAIGLGINSVSNKYINEEFNSKDAIGQVIRIDRRDNEYFDLKYRYNPVVLTSQKREVLDYFFSIFGAYSSEILTEATRQMEIYNLASNNKIDKIAMDIYIRNVRTLYPNVKGIDYIESEVSRIITGILNAS